MVESENDIEDTHGITAIDSHGLLGWNSVVNLKAEEASGGGGHGGTDTISTASITEAHIRE